MKLRRGNAIQKCELRLGNKSRIIIQPENTCPFLHVYQSSSKKICIISHFLLIVVLIVVHFFHRH